MRQAALSVVLCTVVALLTVAGWYILYPSTSDPRNVQYVLWKHGLYHLDPDIALGTMIGDAHRDRLIVGKSKGELMRKFGYLIPGEQLEGRYRRYVIEGGYRDVALLRRSQWLVVFDEGKASKLILLKGI